jgi:phage shock protein A
MAKVTRLRETEADPHAQGGNARTLLATALKESKAAHTAVAKQKHAVKRLFEQQIEAEGKIETLEKAVRVAQDRYVEAVAQAAALEKSTPPVSGVAEATAALAFGRDRVHTLRAGRKVIEEEIPDWEADAAAADTEVDRIISEIIAHHRQCCSKLTTFDKTLVVK